MFLKGEKKPHNHTGSLELYFWDRGSCLEEVKQYNPQDEINFSALAKRYPITVVKSGKLAANPGQIVKQYLIENGIDVDSFSNRYSIKRVKRSRLRYMFFFFNQYVITVNPVSYTHLRAHETDSYLVCRLLLEKKKK